MVSRVSQRCARAGVIVGAAALLLAVAWPHAHHDSAGSHPAPVCRACTLQDGFAAAAPAQPVLLADIPRVVLRARRPRTVSRPTAAARRPSPRAPPTLS